MKARIFRVSEMLSLGLRRRSRLLVIAIGCIFIWTLLPYDNAIILFVRWHLHNIKHGLQPLPTDQPWLWQTPDFPVALNDLGLIVKTGYTTKDRIPTLLNALGEGIKESNIVIVGDYDTEKTSDKYIHNGDQVPVHDVIAMMIERGALAAQSSAPRLIKYLELSSAIAQGDEDRAREIGASDGWKIDILKHISGLELGFRSMPDKKWYVMLDDDSYILKPSLQAILGNLNPTIPHYIGNAVGDYKGRFAHGGSVLAFSNAAMNRLFNQYSQVVAAAHLESVSAEWGDKLIATTAMKAGIYLEEDYSRYFNGDAPRRTHIRPDRFCVPISSFHKMSPAQMAETTEIFKDVSKPFPWIALWDKFNQPLMDEESHTIRTDWDYVGRLDEETMTTDNIRSETACLDLCHYYGKTCVAWTWEAEAHLCHISPWMIVGSQAAGRVTGINFPRAKRLLSECKS